MLRQRCRESIARVDLGTFRMRARSDLLVRHFLVRGSFRSRSMYDVHNIGVMRDAVDSRHDSEFGQRFRNHSEHLEMGKLVLASVRYAPTYKPPT
jgi:hypothetical protein